METRLTTLRRACWRGSNTERTQVMLTMLYTAWLTQAAKKLTSVLIMISEVNETYNHKGRRDRKPARDIIANPSGVVLLLFLLLPSVKKYFSPVFLEARQMFEPRASSTPGMEEEAVEAASEPRAVMMMVTMMERSSKLKLTLPRTIMRMEVTRGSDILIMWVREAELRPRLVLVIKEP